MTLIEQLRTGVVLAAPADEIPPGKGPEWGKAAPIGLLVILLMCAAMWLLFRNMSKHLRKVREAAAAEEIAAQEAALKVRSGGAGSSAPGSSGAAVTNSEQVTLAKKPPSPGDPADNSAAEPEDSD